MTICVTRSTVDADAKREWLASIDLAYEVRRERSALVRIKHEGPLRVQRPFYPEKDGTIHTYLLHPPGGMAIGDRLNIQATLEDDTAALITTPSAGKMYGIKNAGNTRSNTQQDGAPQLQQVNLLCKQRAFCEWLPQETIVFNTAQAELNTRVHLTSSSKYIGWDIIRLGRAASGERFTEGYCTQRLEVYREGELLFRELNKLVASSDMMTAKWGLQGANTLATKVATVELNRDQIDELYALLPNEGEGLWGLTQKKDLFIARYLGHSILDCKEGLNIIWRYVRPIALNKQACEPRIWNT